MDLYQKYSQDVNVSLWRESKLALNHWSQRCGCSFRSVFFKRISIYFVHFMRNCPTVNTIRPQWWFVNIELGNGLVPPGNKPLPEPTLSQFHITNGVTRPFYTSMNILQHLPLKTAWVFHLKLICGLDSFWQWNLMIWFVAWNGSLIACCC